MITQFIFIVLIFFLSMLVELMISSFGFMIPFTALALYYVTVTQGLTIGLISAVINGIIIDAYFYREPALSLWIYIAVAFLAHSWMNKGKINSLLLHMIPGATTALICTVPYIISNNMRLGFTLNSFFGNITHLLTSSIISGIMLPVMIIIFDVFSEFFEFPLYSKASKTNYRR